MTQTALRTALYRLFDVDRQLLYVGIGFDPAARWRAHAVEKDWWHLVADKVVTWHDSREAAEVAEAEAILAERPRFNVVQHRQRYRPPRPGGPLLLAVTETAKEYRDATDRQQAAAKHLAELMRAAHSDGMKQSAILRASKHVWTREYLRIILGLSKRKSGGEK